MDSENPIDEIYNRLLKKALQDGTISPSEQSLLNRIRFDTRKLSNFYDNIREDGVIDTNEALALKDLKASIIQSAWAEADKDTKIEKDESALLNLLLRLLKNLKLEEY